MAEVKLIMPKMGESVVEATVLRWLKKPGDQIEQDEAVLEVATDKVDTEIPSTHAGTLSAALVQEGEVVSVGSPIALIATVAGEGSPTPTPVTKPTASETPATSKAAEPALHAEASASVAKSQRFYSPLVKTIAKQERIDWVELDKIPGGGSKGRLTKKDLIAYLEQRSSTSPPVAAPRPAAPAANGLALRLGEGDEIIQMDRMRRIIATRMVESKQISPHVTSFVEADVTALVEWREREKTPFRKREKEALTYTPVFIDAVVKALLDFPMVNVQVDGERIIRKKQINIGLAVALPSGNLIVPVIKNAEHYNLLGLVKACNTLVNKARDNKLAADDLSGGTFTLSNVGSFGSVMGTPIIMQPQVAILAVGVIQKKPAVISTPYGDAIAIRHKMFLSHSYDHRVVDGALGGLFVRRVADCLESFDPKQLI